MELDKCMEIDCEAAVVECKGTDGVMQVNCTSELPFDRDRAAGKKSNKKLGVGILETIQVYNTVTNI